MKKSKNKASTEINENDDLNNDFANQFKDEIEKEEREESCKYQNMHNGVLNVSDSICFAEDEIKELSDDQLSINKVAHAIIIGMLVKVD